MISADGTLQKGNLGANAILGVSLAVARASAASRKQPLYQYVNDLAGNPTMKMPTPMMNVVNGGAHADSGLNIQEFMIFPTGAPKFSEALRMGAEVFHSLKKILASNGMVTAVGDEGGFAPRFSTNAQALDVILEAVQKAGHAGKMQLALDVAASEFYENGKYHFQGKEISSKELLAYYQELLETYPIISIEDGFAEDDFDGWEQMQSSLGNTLQIVGDDLLVTNTSRIEMAIEKKLCNALLVKPNQIGSLTETIDAVQMAQSAGWNAVMSHRSGESEDSTIADLAVALGTGQIKTGSLSRSDRISKYNQLLRIEDITAGAITFQGKIR
jgi:enolase